jgi:hypothetical protein
MKFGAHMPTSGGAWRALERGIALGCDIVQLFVKNKIEPVWKLRTMGGDCVGFYV